MNFTQQQLNKIHLKTIGSIVLRESTYHKNKIIFTIVPYIKDKRFKRVT